MSNAENMDAALVALDHEEYVDASEVYEIHVEKVAGQQGLGLRVQEGAPGVVCAARGRGWQPVGSQGLADRGGCDAAPQASQLALDPRVSPCVVGHEQ